MNDDFVVFPIHLEKLKNVLTDGCSSTILRHKML